MIMNIFMFKKPKDMSVQLLRYRRRKVKTYINDYINILRDALEELKKRNKKINIRNADYSTVSIQKDLDAINNIKLSLTHTELNANISDIERGKENERKNQEWYEENKDKIFESLINNSNLASNILGLQEDSNSGNIEKDQL